jgi:hypothetical protein
LNELREFSALHHRCVFQYPYEAEIIMAILDARLLPLIETLAAADLDWLAFEIVDGVRAGRVDEETPEALASIRGAIASAKLKDFQLEKRVPAAPTIPAAAQPIVRDEQIRWATEYVDKRLTDALTMLQTSIDQLEDIVSKPPRGDIRVEAGVDHDVSLVFQGEAEKSTSARAQTAEAIAALGALRHALSSWETSTRESQHE